MQSKPFKLENLDYYMKVIDEKVIEYKIMAINMTNKKWSIEFNEKHEENTTNFIKELVLLYNDVKNNKKFRLFEIFEAYIDTTLSKSITIEEVLRRVKK